MSGSNGYSSNGNGHPPEPPHPFHPGGARGATRGREGITLMRAAVKAGLDHPEALSELLSLAIETRKTATNARVKLSAMKLEREIHETLLRQAKELEVLERAEAGEASSSGTVHVEYGEGGRRWTQPR